MHKLSNGNLMCSQQASPEQQPGNPKGAAAHSALDEHRAPGLRAALLGSPGLGPQQPGRPLHSGHAPPGAHGQRGLGAGPVS